MAGTVLSAGVARALVPLVALVGLGLTACSSEEDRCQELMTWYEENPGDSNLGIARDYYRVCEEIPPPVISGELSLDDVT